MESVYANTSKVMVDVEGGNNMMYLPLDKMMQNQSSGQRTLTESQTRANQSINTQSTAPDLSGRADRFNEGRN
jgi:membrane protease subunit HflK